jgi:hypothetical protein
VSLLYKPTHIEYILKYLRSQCGIRREEEENRRERGDIRERNVGAGCDTKCRARGQGVSLFMLVY